jgi:methylmalonyl-CoA/ethylmalonyl-CoA epimerase
MHREDVAAQFVSIASFLVGTVRIELTAPTDERSPIARYIEKRGEGIHHVAFRTQDVEAQLRELEQQGVELINTTAVPGAHNMMIAFLHPKSTGGVLMEVCQPRS